MGVVGEYAPGPDYYFAINAVWTTKNCSHSSPVLVIPETQQSDQRSKIGFAVIILHLVAESPVAKLSHQWSL